MKKHLLGMAMMAGLFITACNNDNKADTTATGTDTTGTGTSSDVNTGSTATTTQSTTTDYAAMADTFQRNSDAGRYYDPQTGKPIKISVDRTTGRKTNATTNQPVTRYVYQDNSDWWVYDAEGQQLGRARMSNNRFEFQDDQQKWVDYDARWKHDGDESKLKTDDMKVKVEKDGDMKIKTKDKKIKVEDGVVKEKDNK